MIGLAVMTYNRLDYLKQCVKSLEENDWGGAEVRIIVDDCSTDGTVEYLESLGADIQILTKEENKGIGHSKNNGLVAMMLEGCDDMFIMEDDIIMKCNKTCLYYRRYAEMFKVEHLNFALHGTMNKGFGRTDTNGIKIYPNCVGAFSYYTRNCIEKIGYMDEKFVNAWEHVEHTYRIAEAGLTTPFWQFADCVLNEQLLEEIPGSIENSSIRPRPDWQQNIANGQDYFIRKHGHWLPPRPK